MKKAIAAAGVTAAIAVAGVTGLGVANAATQNNADNPMSSLVSAIAKKFNLKESEVQAVFDENRSQMQTQRETDVKNQITQLVKDGKLTQAQADLITAKRAELQKQREAKRTSTTDTTENDRKTAREAERTALDKWFSDNNIPTEYRYLVFGGGRGHGGHGGPGGPRGEMRDGDQSSNQSGSSATTSSSSDSTATGSATLSI